MFELISVIVADFCAFVVVFAECFANFGVKGLHLRPEGHHLAPWGLPRSILERFGGSFSRHLGSLGDYMEPCLSLGCPLLGSFWFSLL